MNSTRVIGKLKKRGWVIIRKSKHIIFQRGEKRITISQGKLNHKEEEMVKRVLDERFSRADYYSVSMLKK